MQKSRADSKKVTDKSTKVTTTTTTNLGDIGLTGKNAVELASIVQRGAINQTYAIGEVINPILAGLGNSFSQLVDATATTKLAPEAQAIAINERYNQTVPQKLASKAPLIIIGIGAIMALSKLKG